MGFNALRLPINWSALEPTESGGFAEAYLDTVEAAVKLASAAGPHVAIGSESRLVQVLVKDPEPLLFHAEIVYRNGQAVGYIRAASYGFTLGGAVGLAMIESTAIYCFVVSMILIFANPFWNHVIAQAAGK